jgi:hypothetical protein
MTAIKVIAKNGAAGSPPDHSAFHGTPSFLIFNSAFLISSSARTPHPCLPRRRGDVLPNRAASEMFCHVARCSAMSHHVALFSLYRKTAGFFRLPEAVPLRSLCYLLFNSGPMCVSCAPTRILRAVSRDKCAFRGGDVRQCAVKCANFSRETVATRLSNPIKPL